MKKTFQPQNKQKRQKNVKRGKNKKRLETLNRKNVSPNLFNFLPNA